MSEDHPNHRLQLSLNLRDSPGFLAIVPRPRRLFYNCIIGPGRGPDTSINTVVIVQLITYWWLNEQPACGSALQTLVFAVATLQRALLGLQIHALESIFWALWSSNSIILGVVWVEF